MESTDTKFVQSKFILFSWPFDLNTLPTCYKAYWSTMNLLILYIPVPDCIYHTIHCSWISGKHEQTTLMPSLHHPQWNSTITGWDWWTQLYWANPVLAALHYTTNMTPTHSPLKCVVCAVSACTFVLHSYQQSVTSHAPRTRNGLHYVLIRLQQILPTHTWLCETTDYTLLTYVGLIIDKKTGKRTANNIILCSFSQQKGRSADTVFTINSELLLSLWWNTFRPV